jgi:glycosidase
MRWDATKHAGFCGNEVIPWLPVGYGSDKQNVDVQKSEGQSTLNFVNRLSRIRQDHSELVSGNCETLKLDKPVFGFIRNNEETNESCLILMNFSSQPQTVDIQSALSKSHSLKAYSATFSTCVISTKMDSKTEHSVNSDTFSLRPNEGVILK